MNKTALVLAGVFLLVLGGVAMFVFLKKDDLTKVKKLYEQGTVGAAQQTAEGLGKLIDSFSGKKNM